MREGLRDPLPIGIVRDERAAAVPWQAVGAQCATYPSFRVGRGDLREECEDEPPGGACALRPEIAASE